MTPSDLTAGAWCRNPTGLYRLTLAQRSLEWGRATGRPTVLNRTPESFKTDVQPERPDEGAPALARGRPRRIADLLSQSWHLFVRISFSSLTRRIIFLNVTGLLALVIGILYLSQFRAGLIDARIQSLLVQGEIIAGAIAASATVETDTITIDPERLLRAAGRRELRAFRGGAVRARIPDQS